MIGKQTLLALVVWLAFGGPAMADSQYQVVAASEQYYAELSQNIHADVSSRVEATLALGQYQGANALIGIARASRDKNPDLRIAAIQAVRQWSELAKWDVVSPLLADEVESVKRAAVYALLPLRHLLNAEQAAYVDRQTESYLNRLDDHPQSLLEKAQLNSLMTRYAEAEALYTALLVSEHDAVFARALTVAYSQFLLQQQRASDAVTHLEAVLLSQTEQPTFSDSQQASIHYQLGIAYLKTGRSEAAITQFETAHTLDSNQPQYLYTYATALQAKQPEKAATLFLQLYDATQDPRSLYATCQSQLMAAMDASSCISALRTMAPADVADTLVNQYSTPQTDNK